MTDAPAVHAPTVHRLLDALPAAGEEPVFLLDQRSLPENWQRVEGMVAATAGAEEIRHLLRAGAPRVYLGDAALLDASLIERLVGEFGSERIGVCVPARRMQVSWSMDAVSNADFRVMTPSVCEPCLEILRADGTRTGTHAAWWIGAMFELGASSALLRADIADDADLNILAGLTERWGTRLWVAPLGEANPHLEAWVALGGATQLAVPDGPWQSSAYLAALREAAVADTAEASG